MQTPPAPPAPSSVNNFPATPTSPVAVFTADKYVQVSGQLLAGTGTLWYGCINVNRWWEIIFTTTTQPGSSQSFSKAVTIGVTTSTTQTSSFEQSLGLSAGVDYEGLSAGIQSNMTQTNSTSQTVSFENQTTTTYSFTTESSPSSVSYCVWQLVEEYVLWGYSESYVMNKVTITGPKMVMGRLDNRLDQYSVTASQKSAQAKFAAA